MKLSQLRVDRLNLARSVPVALIGLTLATGGLFKVAAFAREAFIAARFGLSAATDAYFGLQQFPLTVATFMFGAFALAFTPAYAEARRRDQNVEWLPGLLFYGCLFAMVLTVAMLASAPWLLRLFQGAGREGTWNTLAILTLCFPPIVCTGIWAGICTAQGRNIWAMSMTGLPYLTMTLALLGIYAAGALNNLSLPISMTVGYGLVGLYSLFRTIGSQDFRNGFASMLRVHRVPEFKSFLRQLRSSAVENCGFAGNQLLLLYFLSKAGVGIISANNCAMRIGLLGYGLVAQPLAQLVQARLCSVHPDEQPAMFRRWLYIVGGQVIAAAALLFVFRAPVIRLVYMHGKFAGPEFNQVVALLPAWIGYFIVMSMNSIVARYLFIRLNGNTYVRRQLCAYGTANLVRFAAAAYMGAPWIVGCSVVAETCALLLSLRTCLSDMRAESPAPALVTT